MQTQKQQSAGMVDLFLYPVQVPGKSQNKCKFQQFPGWSEKIPNRSQALSSEPSGR